MSVRTYVFDLDPRSRSRSRTSESWKIGHYFENPSSPPFMIGSGNCLLESTLESNEKISGAGFLISLLVWRSRDLQADPIDLQILLCPIFFKFGVWGVVDELFAKSIFFPDPSSRSRSLASQRSEIGHFENLSSPTYDRLRELRTAYSRFKKNFSTAGFLISILVWGGHAVSKFLIWRSRGLEVDLIWPRIFSSPDLLQIWCVGIVGELFTKMCLSPRSKVKVKVMGLNSWSHPGTAYWNVLQKIIKNAFGTVFFISLLVWRSCDLEVDLIWPRNFSLSDLLQIGVVSSRWAIQENIYFSEIQSQSQGHWRRPLAYQQSTVWESSRRTAIWPRLPFGMYSIKQYRSYTIFRIR